MDNKNLCKATNILKKYDQEHLLYLYDMLSEDEKNLLVNQILHTNFEHIISLYKNSMKEELFCLDDISPLEHLEKNDFSVDEVKHYVSIGEHELLNQTYAVVTMAGGQGTRLGYKGPKGTYMLDLKPQKKSLFQIMCEDIKQANLKYNIVIPWYIMTSEENDTPTKLFFEKNNYFDYPVNKIKFFKQKQLPIIDVKGKLILKEPYIIKEASNGNGDVFNSMLENGIIEDLEKNNIKWIFFGGIDNVLLKNVDPLLLGLTIATNNEIASKSIFKEQPLEKTAVYCRNLGKPSILYYENIDLETSEKKDLDGKYLYREANILSHLMSLNAVKKVSKEYLPYHRAYKKNTFVNSEGVKQVPEKPNTFKFEKFIFDAFSKFDDMLLLRVNPDEEFAPIKDFTSIYNPDTAKQKYENYHYKN
mgnify:FL=1